MAVIVLDMDMPNECISCEFHSWSFKRQGIYYRRTRNTLTDYQNSKDENCPLREYHGEETK